MKAAVAGNPAKRMRITLSLGSVRAAGTGMGIRARRPLSSYRTTTQSAPLRSGVTDAISAGEPIERGAGQRRWEPHFLAGNAQHQERRGVGARPKPVLGCDPG